MITVETTGLDNLIVRLDALREVFLSAIEEEMHYIGDDLVSAVSNAAPKSGNESPNGPDGRDEPLSESFDSDVTDDGEQVSLQLTTTQPVLVGLFQTGTGVYGPYDTPIVPTEKKALYWEGAAHPVASVEGMEQNDFVNETVQDFLPDIPSRLSAALYLLMQEAVEF